ncbi:MAG: hypothetical protein BMS9Abin12_1889 [Acidimicrobiia bacterium]|nr:MAG: hypothetical protein BMS9Abin12_1889 [Acidimicrobiia bacterium]
MRNRTLLAVGIGAIVLAFVGPAVAGGIGDQGSTPWGPFNHMRSGYMQSMMSWVDDDFGSGEISPSIEGATEIVVTLDDFSISPSQVFVVEGQAVNITVVNRGAAPHDFTVPELDIRIEVASGDTVTTGIAPQTTGTYDTLCTVPGHESLGMVGSFVVQSRA